jgi:hypothetical protein
MAGLNLDRAYFESGNYQGTMLELSSDRICAVAPTCEQLPEILEHMGGTAPQHAVTATSLAESWRQMFREFRI